MKEREPQVAISVIALNSFPRLYNRKFTVDYILAIYRTNNLKQPLGEFDSER